MMHKKKKKEPETSNLELVNQVGHQNKSKDNTNSSKTSSKILAKPSDTQTELYEQNTDQQYCETKVWLISVLIITKHCLELMITF